MAHPKYVTIFRPLPLHLHLKIKPHSYVSPTKDKYHENQLLQTTTSRDYAKQELRAK